MRDRFALNPDSGVPVDAFTAMDNKGLYQCAHPGCNALVYAHWGPQHHEPFFYAVPGQIHDHSQEGDRTVLVVRKPVSSLIETILYGEQVGPAYPPKKKKRIRSVPPPTIQPKAYYIEKFRDITSLSEIYRSGLCSVQNACYDEIAGEVLGDFFTSYLDCHYLFDSVFQRSAESPFILAGGHIIELIPDRFFKTGMDAFLSHKLDLNGIIHKAYINCHLVFKNTQLLRSIQKQCMSGSRAMHMILVCADFTEVSPPALGKGGIMRTRYSGSINCKNQICVSPYPIEEQTTHNTRRKQYDSTEGFYY